MFTKIGIEARSPLLWRWVRGEVRVGQLICLKTSPRPSPEERVTLDRTFAFNFKLMF